MSIFGVFSSTGYWLFVITGVAVSYYLLNKIGLFNRKFPKETRAHINRKTPAKPDNFHGFFKNHMRGLKGNNKTTYRKRLHELEAQKKRDKMFENMNNYMKLYQDFGDVKALKKARTLNNELARMDGMLR